MPEIFNSSSSSSPSKPSIEPDVIPTGALPIQPEEQTVESVVQRMTTEQRRAKHVDEYSSIMRLEQPSRNPFAAFAAKPLATAFDAQHPDEQVLLLLRQDLITQVKFIFVAVGLILAPILFRSVGLLNFLPSSFQLVATMGWFLLVIGYVMEVFLSWFYNVYIITDERIIDVDFSSLLFKNVSYAKLDNIEDITATTSGALGAIFDFGTVKIQTAGTNSEFEFENIPHPSKVVAFLNELLIEEEQEKLDRRAI
jgi:hypothetical protein